MLTADNLLGKRETNTSADKKDEISNYGKGERTQLRDYPKTREKRRLPNTQHQNERKCS